MGVVIFTADDSRYRIGHYLKMFGTMSMAPVAADTTYILYDAPFDEKDALYWAPLIQHRLVVVTEKPPKLSKRSEDCVIVDQSFKANQPDHGRMMKAAMTWQDRDRALTAMEHVPLPLANAFIRANNTDIDMGRLLAAIRFTLHDDYARAAMAYGHKPNGFSWPKRSRNKDYIQHPDLRKSDNYHEYLLVEPDKEVTEWI